MPRHNFLKRSLNRQFIEWGEKRAREIERERERERKRERERDRQSDRRADRFNPRPLLLEQPDFDGSYRQTDIQTDTGSVCMSVFWKTVTNTGHY